MALIFSKVQRCNIKGAPNGYYGYKEEFDAPAELAKQLVDANVAGYVVKSPTNPAAPPRSAEEIYPLKQEQVKEPEPSPVEPEETPPDPDPTPKPGKKPRR